MSEISVTLIHDGEVLYSYVWNHVPPKNSRISFQRGQRPADADETYRVTDTNWIIREGYVPSVELYIERIF